MTDRGMRRVIREPLVHFAVLGAALLAVYAWTAGTDADNASRIEISAEDVEFLRAGWQQQWNRPPTEDELRGLIDARVREEVLYRAAVAMGLDQNDVVVRRRMVQKMDLLTQDLASLAEPPEEELRALFEERLEEYRVPPRLSFSHVYFNPDARGEATLTDAEAALADLLTRVPSPPAAPEMGDRFMLPFEYRLLTPQGVARQFGGGFAEQLFELEPGWQGPVLSGYGVHLVYVGERVEARVPELAEVRDRVVMDYARSRQARARDALYEGLRQEYEVSVDSSALDR